MEATIYSIRISHPGKTAELMLRHKGIDAERVEILLGSQRLLMRRHGFSGGTVPGLKLDGERVLGTLEIARALERAVPEPSLYPDDPARRAAVEEAEAWGERTWQPVPRRIFRWAVSTDSELRATLAKALGMPVPGLTQNLMLLLAKAFVRSEGGGAEAVQRNLGELPSHLEHIDALIAAGTLSAEEPNAADFQIATTTRVLLNFPQIRPLIEARPAGEHAMRIAADFGREMPVKLPADWLPAG